MAFAEKERARFRPPEPQQNWALFLDLDGTLIEIAASPEAVEAPDSLAPSLAAVQRGLEGALAIVSGRTIEFIDKLTAPLRLPCAGEHSAVIRLSDGAVLRAAENCVVPEDWRKHVRAAIEDWNGVLAEDKPYGIAIHFRMAPEREVEVRALAERIAAEGAPDFEVMPARMAFEIRHRALTKAVAVHMLMAQSPFAGRVPVFVGDDITDEDGFRAAKEMNGLALHVGETFGGKPENVRRWLEEFGSAGSE